MMTFSPQRTGHMTHFRPHIVNMLHSKCHCFFPRSPAQIIWRPSSHKSWPSRVIDSTLRCLGVQDQHRAGTPVESEHLSTFALTIQWAPHLKFALEPPFSSCWGVNAFAANTSGGVLSHVKASNCNQSHVEIGYSCHLPPFLSDRSCIQRQGSCQEQLAEIPPTLGSEVSP